MIISLVNFAVLFKRLFKLIINTGDAIYHIYHKTRSAEEARKAAAILGYNYQSGDWYEKSYKVFYKKYKPKKIKKKKQKEMGLIRKKIKSLFE